MKKKYYSRKGFTLVELLIVIVVIGILSAMMMLSSTEAMSSAKASNIASNLRNLKTAALAWYTDHVDLVTADGRVKTKVTDADNNAKPFQEQNKDDALEIAKYFNNEDSISINGGEGNDPIKAGGYGICDAGGTNRNTWYVGYKFASNEDSIKEKLKGRLKTLGMILRGNTPNNSGETVIWLKVMGEWSPSSN
ncbi:MAG: type II secretion system protein [Synergistaceae bacterium]|nr:type II secretion system protein [Synergistaceae bacterium]MBQ9595328.1 type II secretion system protein [Synergistaceae bacterium]